MKLLPMLLINVVLVAGAIVIYDQLRGEGPATTYQDGGVDPVVIARIEERLHALEGGEPVLRATGSDPRLLARLEEVERRLAVRPPPPPRPGPDGADPRPGGEGFALPEVPPGEQPSAADVARFRRMMEAAEAQRQDERERERLLGTLKGLEITLTPEQTDKLLGATQDYRRKVGEAFRSAFTGGPRGIEADRETARDSARQAVEALRDEFSVTINKFLAPADAQKLVENINLLGGGRGFGGPMMVGPDGAAPPPRRAR